jgi:hypothetical protein
LAVVALAVQCFVGIGSKPWVQFAPEVPADVAAGQVVTAYLQAIAQGDSPGALALTREQPTDVTWLDAEFLQEAVAAQPLTKISAVAAVGQGSDTRQLISAQYELGGTPITGWYFVDLVEGEWLLERATSTIDLSSVDPKQSGLRLNGRLVTQDKVTLFPGIYQLSLDNEWIAVSEDRIVVDAPSAGPGSFSSSPVLTEAGSKAVVAAVKKHLKTCLNAGSVSPPDCGFSLKVVHPEDPTRQVVMAEAKWTVTAGEEELTGLKPTLEVGHPLLTKNYVNVELQFAGVDTEDYQWAGEGVIRMVSANLAGEEVTVVFA